MRITVRQLQLDIEEKLKVMSVRLQRTERESEEMYGRIDRAFERLERFEKNVEMEFREVRNELKQGLSNIEREIAVLTAAINDAFTSQHNRLTRIEKKLGITESTTE